ncbi:MAG: hypothetical protein K2X35_06850 [Bryobacteraceae bacterium]|nr:hypothetical protein [Bryobacteraceae bacterium]
MGAWNIDAGKGLFSGQAIAGGLGLLLVLISAFCGDAKPDVPAEPPGHQIMKNRLQSMEKEVQQLRSNVATLQAAGKAKAGSSGRGKKQPGGKTR